MKDLKEQFDKAAEAVQHLEKKLDNDTLLELYALFKQSTEGDVKGRRPGFTDFKNRAKYDAWSKKKLMQKEEAMKFYIELVQKLL